MPFERGGTKPEDEKIFGNGKCELIANFSATMVTSPRRDLGRDGKCEGRNEKCEFLARESVSSSPIVRIFGKGKCKFIANFSATMVTSLLSLSLSVSLSLTESTLTHRQYRKRFRASYNTLVCANWPEEVESVWRVALNGDRLTWMLHHDRVCGATYGEVGRLKTTSGITYVS